MGIYIPSSFEDFIALAKFKTKITLYTRIRKDWAYAEIGSNLGEDSLETMA